MSNINASVCTFVPDRALLIAIRELDLRAVCRALDRGANPNVCQADGSSTLLKLVADRGDTESGPWVILQELIRAGADHLVTSENGETLVHMAARCDQADAIGMLVCLPGLDVDVRCFEGRTPLFNAAAFGRFYAAKELLEYGADPLVTSDPKGSMGPDYRPLDAIDLEDDLVGPVARLLLNAMIEANGEAA